MSVVECATCGGTGLVCPACTKCRHAGNPHLAHRSTRARKCPNHTPKRVFCDACGADHLELLPDDAEHWWQFWLNKVLCPACAQVLEREEAALNTVLWDALLDRLGKDTGPLSTQSRPAIVPRPQTRQSLLEEVDAPAGEPAE